VLNPNSDKQVDEFVNENKKILLNVNLFVTDEYVIVKFVIDCNNLLINELVL
jgi:hypothetical protein